MPENFDLLGDPIPEGFGKRGRPPHLPTQKNRNKVMLLQALDWSAERIAKALGITTPTLRKHYFRELRARAEARQRVEGALLARLWEKVDAGDVGAMKAFRQVLDRHDLVNGHAAFAGTEIPRPLPAPAKPERLGKKEQAVADAATAGAGTAWGEDLLPPPTPARIN